MPNEEYEVGDVVRLRSGGPEMTVKKVQDSGWIECMWFTKERSLGQASFPKKTVVRVNVAPRSPYHEEP
jgi:uncharacterized protein YodC (DUF2158 family)